MERLGAQEKQGISSEVNDALSLELLCSRLFSRLYCSDLLEIQALPYFQVLILEDFFLYIVCTIFFNYQSENHCMIISIK